MRTLTKLLIVAALVLGALGIGTPQAGAYCIHEVTGNCVNPCWEAAKALAGTGAGGGNVACPM